MRGMDKRGLLSLTYLWLFAVVLLSFMSVSYAFGDGQTTVAAADYGAAGGGGDGDDAFTIPFFLLIGGTATVILIPLIIFLLILLRGVASDYESLLKLRSSGGLKNLRRVVITPQLWWEIGEDRTNLKGDLEDAGVKIKIQQLENNSPILWSLVKKKKMDLTSAQAIEVARVGGLRYAWIGGNRVRPKDLLKGLTTPNKPHGN